MLKLYRDVLVLAVKRTGQSWLAALSLPIYGAVLWVAAMMFAPLGFVGGLLVGLVALACFAGYLYLLSDAVSGSRIQFSDIKRGMRGWWDLCNLAFILGLVWFALGRMGSPAILAVATLAMAFFLNPLPELLYTSRNGTLGFFKESVDFVMQNPFAWFPPNILFAVILLVISRQPLAVHEPGLFLVQLAALASPSGVGQLVLNAPIWIWPIIIVFFHFVMVFRGLLFRELSSGSARLRQFRAQF